VICVEKVGHVMLRVRSLERSLAFYLALGLHEVARGDFGEGMTVFLSTGATHHDIALCETDAMAARGGRSVLHHLAFKIGDAREQLADAKRALEAAGTPILMALDHHVSQGLYVPDPDGNLLELYVDAPEAIWRADPAQVANSDPLSL
jgi:catechol 2,3-dioxygenase